MATLNLLLRLIHGINVAKETDDSQPISFLDLAACLVFVMREVFTGFHKWRFTGLKDREEIGMLDVGQSGFTCMGYYLFVIYFAEDVLLINEEFICNFPCRKFFFINSK